MRKRKSDRKFRICRATYTNDMGLDCETHYYIQRQQKLLGIRLWWSPVRHYALGTEDLNRITITFDTYEEAYAFAAALESGIRPDSWRTEIVSYIN